MADLEKNEMNWIDKGRCGFGGHGVFLDLDGLGRFAEKEGGLWVCVFSAVFGSGTVEAVMKGMGRMKKAHMGDAKGKRVEGQNVGGRNVQENACLNLAMKEMNLGLRLRRVYSQRVRRKVLGKNSMRRI